MTFHDHEISKFNVPRSSPRLFSVEMEAQLRAITLRVAAIGKETRPEIAGIFVFLVGIRGSEQKEKDFYIDFLFCCFFCISSFFLFSLTSLSILNPHILSISAQNISNNIPCLYHSYRGL